MCVKQLVNEHRRCAALLVAIGRMFAGIAVIFGMIGLTAFIVQFFLYPEPVRWQGHSATTIFFSTSILGALIGMVSGVFYHLAFVQLDQIADNKESRFQESILV